ncbi:MAG TPA: TraB/GumN family protein [Ferruginibacter sp.]|nr:TraB/GumN family protein [Ferruginibacter sp.]HMP21467.1 TraB/GumN family protein [Ferruginibacter sp.]
MAPKYSLYLLALLFWQISAAQQPAEMLVKNNDENTLLWQIEGKGILKPSYLFGTFHLMCREDIQFSNQLKQAIRSADTVYMELDMDDPTMLLKGFLMMRMKEGKKISHFVTPEEYSILSNFFKDSLHMPIALLENVKPYFLIALLYPKLMPCKATSGVEEELVKLSKQYKKQIKGLETLAFQSAVFDSIPYEVQAKELVKAINNMDSYRQYFDTMLDVYKNQQLARIETLFKDKDFGAEEYQEVLLDKRNQNWLVQLKELLPQQSVFVAVGAGHLPGNTGLISLLRKEGFTVTPLLNQ